MSAIYGTRAYVITYTYYWKNGNYHQEIDVQFPKFVCMCTSLLMCVAVMMLKLNTRESYIVN